MALRGADDRMARRRFAAAAGALVLVTLLAYAPAMRAGFVWDDDAHVTANRTLRTADGLRRIWCEPGAVQQYYPLVYTTFWAEYQLWGLRPFGYHVVNILLHAVNAILVWQVLSRLRLRGAWMAAAIFALHPVHVESVAWISEQKNVLSGLFYLSALLAFLHFRAIGARPAIPDRASRSSAKSAGHAMTRNARAAFRAGARRPSDASDRSGRERSEPGVTVLDSVSHEDGVRWRFYPLLLVLFLCALLSKTVTASLPMAILLLLWWRRSRITLRDTAALVPLVVLGFVFGLTTMRLEKTEIGAVGEEWSLTPIERGLVAARALWFYAGKLALPSKLTFSYPRWQVDSTTVSSYGYALATVVLLAALWVTRRRLGNGVLVAVLFFAGTLVPALGFFAVYPMRYSFVADHFQYLASLGLIALGTATVTAALEHLGARARRCAPYGGAALLALLGVLVWRQARVYGDAETLWLDTLEKNPTSWMAHNNLGMDLVGLGRIDEAIGHFEEALRLRPDYAKVHNNLGMALIRQRKVEKATEELSEALRLQPNYPEAHNNLAGALVKQGRIDEAIPHLREAARLKPDYAEAHYNWGLALAREGQFAEAVPHLIEAVRLKPDFVEAHYDLAVVLAHQGRTVDAISHLEAALELRPGYAQALRLLDDLRRQNAVLKAPLAGIP